MKNIILRAFVIVLFILSGYSLFGQNSRWAETKLAADSSQRIFLREELSLEDSVITMLFSVRDKMYREVAEVRGNNIVSVEDQNSQVARIRKVAEESIFSILGGEKFRLYTDKIRERLVRSGKQSYEPLTGNSN